MKMTQKQILQLMKLWEKGLPKLMHQAAHHLKNTQEVATIYLHSNSEIVLTIRGSEKVTSQFLSELPCKPNTKYLNKFPSRKLIDFKWNNNGCDLSVEASVTCAKDWILAIRAATFINPILTEGLSSLN